MNHSIVMMGFHGKKAAQQTSLSLPLYFTARLLAANTAGSGS
jgi:hypothetical protein